MSRRFVVIHEAKADFQTATELADRVLLETVDWLDDELIAHQREWIGTNPQDHRLSWTALKTLASSIGIRARGHFNGGPAEPDAVAARRAIRYVMEVCPDSNAILLIRDQDDEPERRDGLKQARDEHRAPPAIVVGFAVIEREAWVICGFDPENDEENARLESERRNLGFDPRLRSNELWADSRNDATRSPKRVLDALSGGDRKRERRCWNSTSLEVLRERGRENGLTEYLDEVRERLAPLIGSGSER